MNEGWRNGSRYLPIHLLIVWEQMGWIREKTEFRLMQPPRAAAAQWDGFLPMGTFELVGKMMCVWCEDYLLGIDGDSYMYIGHESCMEVMILRFLLCFWGSFPCNLSFQ
ncbi:hypothetical protein NPIL_194041 [Nephila pilipes]|uniref:Uncharacterized protein n=1 Tax=Nephila pilipes TaxID=299642 RepID=A0A8X6MSX2_NEPPI|nr:hypothetical protein NPIL_194041 [Nephila pilipes]